MNDFDAADEFGVPANTFGPVPELFYGAIGRVAMLGALVEITVRSRRFTCSGRSGVSGTRRRSPAGGST